MKKNLLFRLVTFYSIVSLLFQSSLPFLYILPQIASAQDVTPTVAVTPSVEPTLIPTAEPTAIPTSEPTSVPTGEPTAIPTSEPTSTPIITPTATPSPWTFEKVELNKEYIAPQNSGVKLTFTKLPTPAGNIKIEEITLTAEQIKQTGSLSDKAYDITSDMKDGTFSYNLSLPIPESSKGKAVEVKFAEELSKISSAEKVDNTLTKTDTSVSVTSLDHMTIFVVTVVVLQPSYATPGGGGVYSAYYGPPSYSAVSPGSTSIYDGREAGIIKAGLNVDTDGHYWDEGLFAFIPTVTIDIFAAGTVTYDVENQAGINPVWMTIEIDTGVVNNRSDNTTYQFVPTTNPTNWHTVNAATGLWQKWNDGAGDTTGNPLLSLSAVASAHPGLNVVRAYLRLGMGDSYYNSGTGTIAWVDKATFGGETYDFSITSVTTNDATGIASNNATLNGFNKSDGATGHSFWVSLAPFVTTSSTIPAGVYSSPDLGSIAANTDFSVSLSSITTTGVPSNLPVITPGTTYYFAAWSSVGGTWYPGEIKTFTTANGPVFIDTNINGILDSGELSFYTIQDAISAASSSNTIHVTSGTYSEVGQIIIDKNLSIVGADKGTTTIKPSSDTVGSGDAGSWILVNDGITFNLSKVTLDGVGKQIRQGIRFNGSGTVNDVIVQNIVQTADYMGFAIVQGYENVGSRTLNVTNSTFTNFGRVGVQTDNGSGSSTATISGNTFTCKGDGDHLDYAITVEGGSVATITNNIISDCRGVASTDGSTSAGISATTFFAGGTTALITGNTITNSTYGIAVGYGGSDTTSVSQFDTNTFSNNDYDLDNHTVNNIDARNNTWSVVAQDNLDQIEARINHNCSNSIYVHGVCSGTDDYSTGGMVQYKNIGAPTNSGWNVHSKSPTPNQTPLDVACGGYTNENSVAQNWTAVSGSNIKYQREVTFPSNSISNIEAGSNTYTSFSTFGSATGIEGLWKTRVRAYVDANSSNTYNSDEEVSGWSNECNITFDKSTPNLNFTDNVVVGPVQSDTIAITVSDINPDTSTYEYGFSTDSTCNSSDTFGNPFTSGTPFTINTETNNGKYICARALDLAGNTSYLSSTNALNIDINNPTVDLMFPTPGSSATSFQAVFSEDVVQSEAENPANYFLNNWPGAGGTGNLSGHATISYSSSTLTATVTFTTPGWSISPEQEWGVRDVHDLAGNLQNVNPYSEYSTSMVKPDTTDSLADSNWHNTSITVNFSCTDTGGSGCKKTYYTTDGSTPTTSSAAGSSMTLSVDGEYTIHYFSVDNAGNVEDVKTAAHTVKIDKTAPTGLDTPAASVTSPTNNTSITWNWTAALDTLSGIQNYLWNLWQSSTVVQSGTTTDTHATLDLLSLGFGDGSYKLDVQSQDNVGNVSGVMTSSSTTVDTVAPTTPSATPVAGDYSSDQSVTLASSDLGSGFKNIYYTLDGTAPDNGKTLYAGAIAVDHDMTIKAIAYDNAGNASDVLTATYGIAPKISSESSLSATSSTATITWTTDDLSTSRVVYDTVDHPVLGAAPNYGYASSTVEDSEKVTSHSVMLTGLSTGVTYYYRVVSHGSPEAVGGGKNFSITCSATKPPTPGSFSLTRVNDTEVKAVWSAVADPVTKYKITWSKDTDTDGDGGGSQTVGKMTETNIGGLELNKYGYYFKVSAINDCITGDSSSVVFVGAGSDLRVTSSSTSSVSPSPTPAVLGAFTTGEATPTEGLSENVLGANTLTPTPVPTGSVLGAENNGKKAPWWPWLFLLLLPAGWFGYRKWKKRNSFVD